MDLSADIVLEAFGCATEENQVDPLRTGQVVHLPPEGEVWMTGDIHDHRRNWDKLIKYADLANNPQRHLILHELIHGDHYDATGAEGSWRMLFEAAQLKCDYPSQVHFLLANHDLAQIHGEGIMKAGISVCEAFNGGVTRDFPEGGTNVTVAITEFLLSLPLAIRTDRGVFFSHSLPSNDNLPKFDYTVFDRPLTGPDYKRRVGPVYQRIWGRHISPAGVDTFAEKMNARLLITGHQPQEMGYAVNGDKHLIVASDHNHGGYLPMDLAVDYTVDDLVERLVKFVGLEL
jgi:hypothetical protein